MFRGQKQLESPEYELLPEPIVAPTAPSAILSKARSEGVEEPLTPSLPHVLPSSLSLTHTGRLVPLYPLTEGLSGRTVRTLIRTVLDGWAGRVLDPLPMALLARHRFPPLAQALRQAHYPDDLHHFVRARRRLAFDELLALQLWMLQRRLEWQGTPAAPIPAPARLLQSFRESLPFQLTRAQDRVLAEMLRELDSPVPMLRLLQGDVGSGKTVVAAAALMLAAASGRQAAIMAPTEILAEQHYRSLCRLFGASTAEPLAVCQPPWLSHPLRLGLLTGSLGARLKRTLQTAAAQHEVDILVGTHALIQEAVAFADLPLAVIDEQHRFGTAQRQALRQKGGNPHILVMTATPVPRTLALTLYGDLELSVIDEMPPGRWPVETRVVEPFQRAAAERFLHDRVREGRQAYVVCPLIDESERVQARAATEEHRRLATEVFPDLRLGLLHGRMSPSEKDGVMSRFRGGQLDILVSTTVIEVGIDVPNATVMLIEGADRFGLSQLHQLRGRVGRGEHVSYCLLLLEEVETLGALVGTGGTDAFAATLPVSTAAEFNRGDILVLGPERMRVSGVREAERLLVVERGIRGSATVAHRQSEPISRFPERLAIMESISDGFRLAEQDFRLRGPGTFAGTRQSGLSELRMAQLPRDRRLLEDARLEARRILEADPGLSGEHTPLRVLLERLHPAEGADVS